MTAVCFCYCIVIVVIIHPSIFNDRGGVVDGLCDFSSSFLSSFLFDLNTHFSHGVVFFDLSASNRSEILLAVLQRRLWFVNRLPRALLFVVVVMLLLRNVMWWHEVNEEFKNQCNWLLFSS